MTKGIVQRLSARFFIAAAVVAAGTWSRPASAAAVNTPGASADQYFARELERLGQKSAIKTALSAAKGTPAESVFDAAQVYSSWEDLTRAGKKEDRYVADTVKVDAIGQRYLADINKVLESGDVDPYWSLEQAKFIFARLTEAVVNRIEYFGAGTADRNQLAPLAKAAVGLLDVSAEKLPKIVTAFENANPFDENGYKAASAAAGEVGYNQAFGYYFQALSEESGAPDRAKILGKSAELLAQWADGDADNGVKWQSLLLRGKANSEAGKYADAFKDFIAAEDAAAPNWVQYQSRYQTVVTHARNKDFESATAELEKFKSWVDQTQGKSEAAKASLDMLDYRVQAAKAAALPDEAARVAGAKKATEILSGILERQPLYRDLVFQQLAAAVPEGADPAKLPPLQALAMASSLGGNADPNELEGKKQLSQAVTAALAVRNNPQADVNDQREAALIAGVCNTKLGRLLEAAKSNVDFAALSVAVKAKTGHEDPRAKQIVELALAQIGQVMNTQQTPSKELNDLKTTALALATGEYHDDRWRYAQGISQEEDGQLDKAAETFDAIASNDPNYMDARYRLLRISLHALNQAAEGEAKMNAARDLLRKCDAYLNPPPGMPKEALDAVKEHRTDILLIEASTALNPLHDAPTAHKLLDQLEADGKPTTQLQGAILRYRILAFQVEGRPDEASKLVQKYVDQFPEQASDILKGMIAKNIEEITDAEKSDPAKAKQLAGQVVTLLQSLLDWAKTNPKKSEEDRKKDVYAYQQLLAYMLVRAGNAPDAIALYKQLQTQNPPDFNNFMGEARAIFASGDYPTAHDYFIRLLPKLALGSESYWEAYLRVLQSNEAMGKNTDQTTKALKDLRVSYGDAIGGKTFKREFRILMDKYQIP